MCGLSGAFRTGPCQCSETAAVVSESLAHRGPDHHGSFRSSSGAVELSFYRLAIVDPSERGVQPFLSDDASEDTGWAAVCNGEIYNAALLRSELDWDFESQTDCEVVIPAVMRWGVEGFARRAQGQFAFCVARYRLSTGAVINAWLCRDPFGINPLHVASCPHALLFASEAKALPGAAREVLAGHVLEFSEDGQTKDRRWMEQTLPWAPLNSLPHVGDISAALERAVTCRLTADVPVAVFLSGGVDSSIIAALAARILRSRGQTLQTFTVFHSDSSPDEILDARSAREVAKYIGSEHREFGFSTEEGLAALPEVVRALETHDVMAVSAAVPLYLLARFASQNFGVRAVLVGEGADEMFAGYSLFAEYDTSALGDFSQEIERRLALIGDAELVRVDRSTMAWGVEARVPFLDVELVSLCMHPSLTERKLSHVSVGRVEKALLRESFVGTLPDSVLWRRKEQFADGIGRQWVRDLQRFARDDPAGSEKALFLRLFKEQLGSAKLPLVSARSQRRREFGRSQHRRAVVCGSDTLRSMHSVRDDPDLSRMISLEDARQFCEKLLDVQPEDEPSLPFLNRLIAASLRRLPYHNLTVLVRPRRPPTNAEIRDDFLSGIGGPCAVLNAGFAALLHAFGFDVSLTPATIHRPDCHVALIVQLGPQFFYVDVANGKPYFEAAPLQENAQVYGLPGPFPWKIQWNGCVGRFELFHGKLDQSGAAPPQVTWNDDPAVVFNPRRTVDYASFRPMVQQSRTDRGYGPFLHGLRVAQYPHGQAHRVAIRDASLFDGADVRQADSSDALLAFVRAQFAPPAEKLTTEALAVLRSQGDGLWPVENEAWALEGRWVELLGEFLALRPFSDGNIPGVQEALTVIAGMLQERGFSVRRFTNPGDGADALCATREPRGSTTDWIGLFGHVDVELVSEPAWPHTDDPMTPFLAANGRWYCRGIADNLGPLLARLLAFSASDVQSRGVVWTIHGEEEIGSPFAHQVYPTLADEVREVRLVNLWCEETGYFNRDGQQRVLVLNQEANPSLMSSILQFLEQSSSAVGRGFVVENRCMNKAFGTDRCPCLTHLLGQTPYLAVGINDSWSNIHAENESVPRDVLRLAYLQFRHVFDIAAPAELR